MQLEAKEISSPVARRLFRLGFKRLGETSGPVWAEPGTGAVLDA